jgi:hypothetical protein
MPNTPNLQQTDAIPRIIQEATEPPPVVVADRNGDAFHSLHIGRKTKISFHRTLRVPEDGNDYPLPAGLGALQIHRVEDYAETVPPHWLEEGGFFIPLYQREALFIQFEGEEWCPSIAKVCVGQINAITGNPFSEKLSSHSQDYVVIPKQQWLDGINSGDGTVKQFVAMPLGRGYTVEAQITDEEKHGGFQLVVYEPIDGRFRVTPDSANKRVEYIIAACLKKFDLLLSQSNAFQRKIVTSVQEGKLTCSGISFITGLENERVEYLYQEFRKKYFEIVANTTRQYLGEDKDKFLDVGIKVFFGLRSLGLKENIDLHQDKKAEKIPRDGVLMSSPEQDYGDIRLGSSPVNYSSAEAEEMGIAAGGRIKQQIFSDTYGVESWDCNRRRALKLHIVNSGDYKRITGQDPPPSPISADQYQISGIPWFSNYNETADTIKGAESFKRMLGVDEIDKRRGNEKTTAELKPTITPQLIHRIKTPDIKEAAHEFRNRASESIAAGRWKMAIREIDYLIDLGVSAKAADYAVRAYGNFQIDRFLEAVMDADTALELDAGFYEARATRARCRLALGDFLGSKEDAQLLTQGEGSESVGYEIMAEANMLLSDYAGAISDAFFATLFDPENRRAQEISSQARDARERSENNYIKQ